MGIDFETIKKEFEKEKKKIEKRKIKNEKIKSETAKKMEKIQKKIEKSSQKIDNNINTINSRYISSNLPVVQSGKIKKMFNRIKGGLAIAATAVAAIVGIKNLDGETDKNNIPNIEDTTEPGKDVAKNEIEETTTEKIENVIESIDEVTEEIESTTKELETTSKEIETQTQAVLENITESKSEKEPQTWSIQNYVAPDVNIDKNFVGSSFAETDAFSDKKETNENVDKNNTEKRTEKKTENYTEKNTEKRTEKKTEKRTEKNTENKTEKQTEKQTKKTLGKDKNNKEIEISGEGNEEVITDKSGKIEGIVNPNLDQEIGNKIEDKVEKHEPIVFKPADELESESNKTTEKNKKSKSKLIDELEDFVVDEKEAAEKAKEIKIDIENGNIDIESLTEKIDEYYGDR